MGRLNNIFFLLLLALCAGCSGVKNLTRPDVQSPEAFSGQPLDTVTIADIGWWEFYGDEYLKTIIEKVLEENKQMLIAAERVEQARYLYNVEKASLLPELSFRLPWNHETNSYYKELKLIDPEIGVKASITWEIDLFGALRWNKKKALSQFRASEFDLRAMRMLLVAETATAYFRLVALDNELEIVRSTMVTREEGVRLAKLRFDGGLTSETVYQQAQVQYATAAALIPNIEYNIKVAENRLLLLMGELPDQKVARSSYLKDNTLPDRVPLGIPSSLLERRPDIQASEQKLQAAVANVGYTFARRFPSLNIELTGGVEDNDFKNLFRSPFSYVAENFVAPLFDFGKRKNRYKAAVAAYNEARLSYESKVLEAFGEVDNARTRYRSARMAVTKDTELLDAAAKYQELTWKQYRGGTINYIDVLDAQRRFFEAQVARMNAIRDEHFALIQLYKALGGGWTLP